jgi:hypothetical protein
MIDINIIYMKQGFTSSDLPPGVDESHPWAVATNHAANPCEGCGKDNDGTPLGTLGSLKEITLAPPSFTPISGVERENLPVRKFRLCFECVAKLRALLMMP